MPSNYLTPCMVRPAYSNNLSTSERPSVHFAHLLVSITARFAQIRNLASSPAVSFRQIAETHFAESWKST